MCILGDSTGSILAYDALTQLSSFRLVSELQLRNDDNLHEVHGDAVKPVGQCTSSDSKCSEHDSQPNTVSDDAQMKHTHYEDSHDRPTGAFPTSSENALPPDDAEIHVAGSHSSRRADRIISRFDFEVSDLFMFGSPLALVLTNRSIFLAEDERHLPPPPPPACRNVFNLSHANDPTAVRLEPLLDRIFHQIPPLRVARYTKYPFGDGDAVHVGE